MARNQKCDIKVENTGGLGGEVGLIFATYRCSMGGWAANTTQTTRNGYTGRLAPLLAAAALNAHDTNARPGGLCARIHTNENLLVLVRL